MTSPIKSDDQRGHPVLPPIGRWIKLAYTYVINNKKITSDNQEVLPLIDNKYFTHLVDTIDKILTSDETMLFINYINLYEINISNIEKLIYMCRGVGVEDNIKIKIYDIVNKNINDNIKMLVNERMKIDPNNTQLASDPDISTTEGLFQIRKAVDFELVEKLKQDEVLKDATH